MKNAYILLTEVLLSMQHTRGRVLQIEGRLTNSNPAVARAAVGELAMVREDMLRYADILVEVQAMLPEPTKGEIMRHYNPDAVDVKPLVLDPEAFLGTPGPGKSASIKAHLGTPEPAFSEAILSMEEGPVGTVDDKRPAGWTEALALEFIGVSAGHVGQLDTFANLFVHGDWPTIQREWPEFQVWINKQLEGGHG